MHFCCRMSLNTVDFSRFPIRRDHRVLDLGCGQGRHIISAWSLTRPETLGVDKSLEDLKISRERFYDFHTTATPGSGFWLSLADGQQLPFADNSFDRVICSEMLEHVHDFERVLAEIDRVLKPGGLLVVSIPSQFPEWVCWRLAADYHSEPGGHVRIFSGPDLRQRIERLDMTLYARHHAHALHVPYWWLKCWYWGRSPEPWPVRIWHRLLVWDLMQAPFVTRFLEQLLNPLIGKSLVMYFVQGSKPTRDQTFGAET